jgi:ADP-ribose pyrophosphatase YjhB (NUDIX family)
MARGPSRRPPGAGLPLVSPEQLPTPRYCQLCGHPLVERYLAHEERWRLQCEHCGFVHYMNPRVVAAVAPERDGRILLMKRAWEPRAGFWTIPGGFLEMGESAEEGAVRETAEEAGVEVELRGLLGVYTRRDAGIVVVIYRGLVPDDATPRPGAEALELRWFGPGDIPWEELAFPTTVQALKDWVAAQAERAQRKST